MLVCHIIDPPLGRTNLYMQLNTASERFSDKRNTRGFSLKDIPISYISQNHYMEWILGDQFRLNAVGNGDEMRRQRRTNMQ